MLNEEIYEKLADILVKRIEKTNTFVLKEIAKKIKEIGALDETRAFQLRHILKYGGDYDKIVEKLAETLELNVKDIYKIFEEFAKKDQKFAKKFYDYREAKFIPFDENIALQNQVEALARLTASTYINFSQTLAFARKDAFGNIFYTSLADTYQEIIDTAILSVSQGKETFNRQMGLALKELASSGLKSVDYATGYHRRLDSSVRMNMLDGLRTLHDSMQMKFGEEFKADGVEITVHENPADDHASVQGRQFSHAEYNKLQQGLEAKDINDKKYTLDHNDDGKFRAISQLNCYHTIFNIIIGVSTPQYNDEQLNKIIQNNEKGFEFDGKKYTMYEGTQLQRKIETEIRRQKDIIASNIDKDIIEKAKYKKNRLRDKYIELCRVSGLPYFGERMRIIKPKN